MEKIKIEFSNRLSRLPPYVLGELNEQKLKMRQKGIDVIDFGMGNPDRPTPEHIVDKAREILLDPRNHRYSASKGIFNLRKNIAEYYERKWDVSLDPNKEAIAVIGSKEGLSHMALAILGPGDTALVPNPAFPIHTYSFILAGANVISVPLSDEQQFMTDLKRTVESLTPQPKVLLLNYPNNPTTRVVTLDFFEEVVNFARSKNIAVIHDFAYGDIVYDGYKAPSFLQAKGAKDVGVEFFTMSKTYNMAGWRVGFCCGNADMISGLARIKGYYDYGIFQVIQIAAIMALKGPQASVKANVEVYQKRRDILCDGLNAMGWNVEKPKATMFVWAPIPEPFREMGSMEFCRMLLDKANVSMSPGIGFGSLGEGYVRIGLVENEKRIQQALRNMKHAMFPSRKVQ